jgi:dsDNA-binding SOS-regulon protein
MIQKTPGGFYFVPGRNGQPGRSFPKKADAQRYDRELDACPCGVSDDELLGLADALADTVEAYLQALNEGVLHAEIGLRQALDGYRLARPRGAD